MSVHPASRSYLGLLVASFLLLVGCQDKDAPVSDMNIGAVCQTDDDCIDNLTCETQGPLIDGQCTMFCGSNEHCTEQLGEKMVCIVSANRCVRQCVSAKDCPLYTYCGLDGWCVR